MSEGITISRRWAFLYQAAILAVVSWGVREAVTIRTASQEHASQLLVTVRMIADLEGKQDALASDLTEHKESLIRLQATNEVLTGLLLKRPDVEVHAAPAPNIPESIPEEVPTWSEPPAEWDDSKANDYLKQRQVQQQQQQWGGAP